MNVRSVVGAAQFLLLEKFVAPKARHYLLEWFHSTFKLMTPQPGKLFPKNRKIITDSPARAYCDSGDVARSSNCTGRNTARW